MESHLNTKLLSHLSKIKWTCSWAILLASFIPASFERMATTRMALLYKEQFALKEQLH